MLFRSREVHDGVDALGAQEILDERGVADAAVNETQLGTFLGARQSREIAGIRQRIEDDEPLARMPRQPVMHEIRTDEAGASGDEQATQSAYLQRL